MHPSLRRFWEVSTSGEPQIAVMFGDSITFGSQVDPDADPDITYHRQWHDRLAKRIPNLQLQVLNRGVPGNKIADAHTRLERDVLAEHPDLVVVEFGINDCWDGPDQADTFERELGRLADRIRAANIPALVFLTANMMNHAVSPEAQRLAWFAEQTARAQASGWMDDYMDRMRRVARQLDIPIAEGYNRWKSLRQSGVDTDSLLANRANHPNRQGHRLLAEALLEVFDASKTGGAKETEP